MRIVNSSMDSEDLNRCYGDTVVDVNGRRMFCNYVTYCDDGLSNVEGYEDYAGTVVGVISNHNPSTGKEYSHQSSNSKFLLPVDDWVPWFPEEGFLNCVPMKLAFLMRRKPQRQWRFSYNHSIYEMQALNQLEESFLHGDMPSSLMGPYCNAAVDMYNNPMYASLAECERSVREGEWLSRAFSPKYVIYSSIFSEKIMIAYFDTLIGTVENGTILLNEQLAFLVEDLSQFAPVELDSYVE